MMFRFIAYIALALMSTSVANAQFTLTLYGGSQSIKIGDVDSKTVALGGAGLKFNIITDQDKNIGAVISLGGYIDGYQSDQPTESGKKPILSVVGLQFDTMLRIHRISIGYEPEYLLFDRGKKGGTIESAVSKFITMVTFGDEWRTSLYGTYSFFGPPLGSTTLKDGPYSNPNVTPDDIDAKKGFGWSVGLKHRFSDHWFLMSEFNAIQIDFKMERGNTDGHLDHNSNRLRFGFGVQF